jgi:hypothetical protein
VASHRIAQVLLWCRVQDSGPWNVPTFHRNLKSWLKSKAKRTRAADSAFARRQVICSLRMGGLFIDYFIEFLIRTAIRMVRNIRSRSWPEYEGSILSTEKKQSFTWCPLVTVYYEYVLDGARHGSWQTRAFLLSAAAEEYASTFVKGAAATIRVKPNDVSVSVWKDRWRYWE